MASEYSSLQHLDALQGIRSPTTPEEKVRNRLLQLLVKELAYPPHVILVEKSLNSFLRATSFAPSFAHGKRRLDVLVISPVSSSLGSTGDPKPLLLIECKAQTVNKKTINQVLSYNQSIQAPCISIVCAQTQHTGFKHPTTQALHVYPGIPTFSQLLAYHQWFESQLPPSTIPSV